MRTFLIIWLGQVLSLIGSGLTGFALAVWIFEATGQATPFALTALFASLPRILISPVAGVIADRVDRRLIMILADSGSAAVTLAALLILRTSELQIWHIYLIAVAGSIFGGFQEPAYTASITMLIPKTQFARASGMVQMSQALETLISPVLAGILFVTIGLQGIILIDFLTYFFAIGALLVVRIPQPAAAPEEADQRRSLWDDLVFGWRYLRARAGLLGLLIYFGWVNYLFNGAFVLLGPLVLSFADASVLGTVQSVMGVGMLLGSVTMSAWGGPSRRIHGVIGFIALGGIGLATIGLQPSALVIGAGMFLLAFAVPLASGPSQAIFQSKVEPAVQGRVFAIRTMISRSMMPLAFLSAGPLADRLFEPWMRPPTVQPFTAIGSVLGFGAGRGVGLMFTVAGILLLIVTGIAFSYPRIRLVEDELPDVLQPEVENARQASASGQSPEPEGQPQEA